MNKLLILIALPIFLGLNTFAQSTNFLWAKQLGGVGDDISRSCTVDAAGNVYTTGTFSGTADFDPGPGIYNLAADSNSRLNGFISKLDAAGNFLWAKKIGGINQVYCNSIVVDANGNVYIIGYFSGTAEFGAGSGITDMTSTGSSDAFVLKLDASGNYIWAKQIGGSGIASGISITVDANGNVCIVGTFSGGIDFDPGLGIYDMTSIGTYDVFILKLDTSGNFIYAKQIGGYYGSGYTEGNSIAVDASGNVYTTGFFSGQTDFDPGPGIYNMAVPSWWTISNDDVFILKLDASGNFLWAKQLGGVNDDHGLSIAVDANGNVYTTGYFHITADFDPGPGIYNMTAGFGNASGVFVSKLDALGNFLWAKQLGGFGGDIGNSIAVDGNGNVYTTGYFTDTADFDPGPGIYNMIAPNPPGSIGNYNVFISKLDASGNFLWAKQLGGTNSDQGNSLAVDAIGNVYTTGYFRGTADFDPGPGTYNLTSFGGRDAFVVKLNNPILFIEPQILLSKAVLNVNESQVITGSNFTLNGIIYLSIKNEFNETVGGSIPITYISPGKFTYTLPITNLFKPGEYQVYATDSSTGKNTPVIKFRVNNPVQRKLWINKPLGSNSYMVNQTFQIQWGDYIAKSLAIGKSGFVQKSYKIEISNDNGASWQIAINPVVINNGIAGKDNNNFSALYHQNTPGTYKIRITDNENSSDFNISEPFTITDPTSHGFFTQLGWDFSSPSPVVASNPIGLAADGTCRIFVKLLRSPGNAKTVASIHAEIKPVDGSFTTTDMLGKILYATDTVIYSLQGNNAIATNATYTATGNGNKDGYWFWLVAPDDFTQDLNNQSNTRYINTDFLITYTDNSTELVSTNDQQPIEIVRPILFLVHGINSDESAFEGLYNTINIEGLKVYFDNENFPKNPLWKIVRRLHLFNYTSYATNAQVILGMSNVNAQNYYSTFQFNLRKMHDKGYASNRVDYVCHSMGGDVARTIINKYQDAYRPSPGSSGYKNYDSGFIHKLITINTPHNGSYLADLFIDRFYSSNFYAIEIRNSLFNQSFPGFFQNGLPSNAAKDLRAFNGGIRFSKTTDTKNHEIGSDVDDAIFYSEQTINRNNLKPSLPYAILLPPNVTVNSYIFAHYNNNNEYLHRTDMIVPKSSQFPNTNQPILDLQSSLTGMSTASILKGIDKNHLNILGDPAIGNRVMYLLNAPINSGFFADTIAANTNPGGSFTYKPSSPQEMVINYMDTSSIKIFSPVKDSIVYVDSTIQVTLNIKDTAHLQRIRLGFQSEFYDTYSKASNQVFDMKVLSSAIGKNILMAEATYDSSGTIINHVDTITLNVISLDTLKGFYLYPKSQYLNRQQTFKFDYNAIYTNYIGELNSDIDSLSFIILDTNVVYFDSVNRQFVTKDTGTTHIIFNYKSFSDTAFIYISEPLNYSSPLPVTLISFNGYGKPAYNLLEWKTAAEINFSHFILERSMNGSSWTEIATINSRSNSGTGITDYDYKDLLISNNITFYRLLLVDIDGNYKISNTVLIRRSNDNSSIKVFPNPVTKSEVFIDLGSYNPSSKVVINVVDLSGKNVKTINQTIQNNSLIRLDLNGLKPSIYMLKIQKGNDMKTVKLVVLE